MLHVRPFVLAMTFIGTLMQHAMIAITCQACIAKFAASIVYNVPSPPDVQLTVKTGTTSLKSVTRRVLKPGLKAKTIVPPEVAPPDVPEPPLPFSVPEPPLPAARPKTVPKKRVLPPAASSPIKDASAPVVLKEAPAVASSSAKEESVPTALTVSPADASDTAKEVPAPEDQQVVPPSAEAKPMGAPQSKIIPVTTDPFTRQYWPCPTCAKPFRSQYHVQKHMNMSHGTTYDLALVKKDA